MERLNLSVTLFLILFSGQVLADNRAIVQTFYDFLSKPVSTDAADVFKESTSENWDSIGDYSGGKKNYEQFIGQISGFFAKLIPNLNWGAQGMIQYANKVVVRGRATGTPNGPLFGVDGEGKSFDILTIDIHTIEKGKIISSYPVEDWAGALQQLSSK